MLRHVTGAILAALFLLGAIANVYMGVFSPSVYEPFAANAILRPYRDLWNTLVYPSIRLFLVPVVLVELALAWLLLRSGTYVKVGLWIALALNLFLVPFWWGGGAIANVFLALLIAWLLRYDYPKSVPEAYRGDG